MTGIVADIVDVHQACKYKYYGAFFSFNEILLDIVDVY